MRGYNGGGEAAAATEEATFVVVVVVVVVVVFIQLCMDTSCMEARNKAFACKSARIKL